MKLIVTVLKFPTKGGEVTITFLLTRLYQYLEKYDKK